MRFRRHHRRLFTQWIIRIIALLVIIGLLTSLASLIF